MLELLRGKRRLLLIGALVLAAAAAGGYALLERNYTAPGPSGKPVRLNVTAGESLHEVFAQLAGLGALRHPRVVEAYMRLRGIEPRIEIGVYDIPAHSSPAQIVRLFVEGRVVLDRITVVEGTTFAEFLHQLDADPDIDPTLRGKSDRQIMAALGHAGQNPEGRFFPSTYIFSPGTPDITILRMAYEKMSSMLARVWRRRSAQLPLKSPYQALILASMIEKETGVAGERRRIAGVFVNRLRRGMKLQSDPTVIYGLGSRYHGAISIRDLATATPYNTYTRNGLPPTPICLPGVRSLRAAVHPDRTRDLYFVATGKGGHHFSRTLATHDAQVRSYLAQLRLDRERAERHKAAQ